VHAKNRRVTLEVVKTGTVRALSESVRSPRSTTARLLDRRRSSSDVPVLLGATDALEVVQTGVRAIAAAGCCHFSAVLPGAIQAHRCLCEPVVHMYAVRQQY
jgi:hypothetical protein